MVLLQIYRLSQSVSAMSGKLEGTNGSCKRTWHVAVSVNFPKAVEDLCVLRLHPLTDSYEYLWPLFCIHTQNNLQLRSASPERRNKQIHTVQVNTHQPVDTCASGCSDQRKRMHTFKHSLKQIEYESAENLGVFQTKSTTSPQLSNTSPACLFTRTHSTLSLKVSPTCRVVSMHGRFKHQTKQNK